MKRSVIILPIISLALIFSCTEEKKKEVSKDLTITRDTLDFKAQTPLHEGSSHAFDMTMNIEWPTDAVSDETLKNMQKEITGMLFGSDLSTTDIEYAMNAYNARSSDLYRQNCDITYDDLNEEKDYMMDGVEYITGAFLEPYKNMVSYKKLAYGYSGGAHGLDSISCITFDMKSGERISYESLFKEGYQDRLLASLRANLLFSTDDPEMLWEKEIYPNDNFYLTDKGITYVYQRYEIGPYVIGIIEVTVPWKEIKDILK